MILSLVALFPTVSAVVPPLYRHPLGERNRFFRIFPKSFRDKGLDQKNFSIYHMVVALFAIGLQFANTISVRMFILQK